ncbi:hypothetical protein GGF32_005402 [Allomyces javanicus]|nr:hypothetical protein GGF32_005402 [Allomyces javanicus]
MGVQLVIGKAYKKTEQEGFVDDQLLQVHCIDNRQDELFSAVVHSPDKRDRLTQLQIGPGPCARGPTGPKMTLMDSDQYAEQFQVKWHHQSFGFIDCDGPVQFLFIRFLNMSVDVVEAPMQAAVTDLQQRSDTGRLGRRLDLSRLIPSQRSRSEPRVRAIEHAPQLLLPPPPPPLPLIPPRGCQ